MRMNRYVMSWSVADKMWMVVYAATLEDGEGSDVFERDDSGALHYIGSIYGYLPGELSEMADEEFEQAVYTCGMFSNI